MSCAPIETPTKSPHPEERVVADVGEGIGECHGAVREGTTPVGSTTHIVETAVPTAKDSKTTSVQESLHSPRSMRWCPSLVETVT
jgi:hypothetical protein